jgi:predicted adenylyl cyclase CyaB
MIELERRYSISDATFSQLQTSSEIAWSDAKQVTDITFGPSGAESMQIDGWVLRLRKTETSCELQFKSPANQDWTAWKEISVTVDSASNAVQLLSAIGLRIGLLLDRSRSVGCWRGYKLSLDDFAILGKFIEVEVEANAHSAEAPAFVDFLDYFGIPNATECEPYGLLMLKRLKAEPELGAAVEEYVRSLA